MRKAAIHPGPNSIAAKAEENLSSRSFHRPGQRNILQQVATNRRVSADAVISLTRDENVLSIRSCSRRPGITDQCRTISRRQLGEDNRHDSLFPESEDFLFRRI